MFKNLYVWVDFVKVMIGTAGFNEAILAAV